MFMVNALANGDCRIEFEPCSRLEDLNLNMRKISKDIEDRSDPSEALSTRFKFSLKI